MKITIYPFALLFLICFSSAALAQVQPKTIFLVRHAEKANDGTSDPSLSEKGSLRAENLSRMLSTANIEFIYSTDYKRTKETGRPLATLLNKEISIYDPRDELAIDGILDQSGDSRILIVGHSNTIPGLVNKLIGKEEYSQLAESEYDKLFVLTSTKDGFDCLVLTY